MRISDWSSDVCSSDLPNIAESYKSIGGAICEVNAAPGFRMHVAPSEGTASDAAGPVIDMLFPPGTPARVPIAAITGTNGKTTTKSDEHTSELQSLTRTWDAVFCLKKKTKTNTKTNNSTQTTQ